MFVGIDMHIRLCLELIRSVVCEANIDLEAFIVDRFRARIPNKTRDANLMIECGM